MMLISSIFIGLAVSMYPVDSSTIQKRLGDPQAISRLSIDTNLFTGSEGSAVTPCGIVDLWFRSPSGKPVKVRRVSLDRLTPALSDGRSSPSWLAEIVVSPVSQPNGWDSCQKSGISAATSSISEVDSLESLSRSPEIALSRVAEIEPVSMKQLLNELISVMRYLTDMGVSVDTSSISTTIEGGEETLVMSAGTAPVAPEHQMSSLFSGLHAFASPDLLSPLEEALESLITRELDWEHLIGIFNRPQVPLADRVKASFIRCDDFRFTEVSTCLVAGNSIQVSGWDHPIVFPSSGVDTLDLGDRRIYTNGDILITFPQSMTKNAARLICRERALLTELYNEGLPVARPLTVVSSDMPAACIERMMVQEGTPMEKSWIPNVALHLVDLVEKLHAGPRVSLGSISGGMFSSNLRLMGCPWCRLLESKLAVRGVDEDDSDEEDADPVKDDLVGLVNLFSLGGSVSSIDELRRKLQPTKTSGSASVESRSSAHVDSSAYATEDRVYTQCMESAESDPILTGTCFNRDFPVMVLTDGSSVEFDVSSHKEGNSAKSYTSTDGKYIVKVLKVNPQSPSAMCRERGIMHALSSLVGSGIARGVDVDWERSGLSPRCAGTVMVMINSGRWSLIQYSGSEWKSILKKITNILEQVHASGYFHGDTNMGNFVYSDPDNVAESLTLIDFGLSGRVTRTTFEPVILNARTRIKDLFMAFVLARFPSGGNLSPGAHGAIEMLRSLGTSPESHDSPPPYSLIYVML